MAKAKRTVKIVRTWRRDGSTNEMSVEAAICNLKQNGWGAWTDERIKKRLLDGEEFTTQHAVLRMNF